MLQWVGRAAASCWVSGGRQAVDGRFGAGGRGFRGGGAAWRLGVVRLFRLGSGTRGAATRVEGICCTGRGGFVAPACGGVAAVDRRARGRVGARYVECERPPENAPSGVPGTPSDVAHRRRPLFGRSLAFQRSLREGFSRGREGCASAAPARPGLPNALRGDASVAPPGARHALPRVFRGGVA